jgi:hypothetical protein
MVRYSTPWDHPLNAMGIMGLHGDFPWCQGKSEKSMGKTMVHYSTPYVGHPFTATDIMGRRGDYRCRQWISDKFLIEYAMEAMARCSKPWDTRQGITTLQ